MDLDDLFRKIEKKQKPNQNLENSKQIKQTQEKVPHQLKLKLNHEINRLELCKLTPENIYQALSKQPQQELFENEIMEAKLMEMVGEQNLYDDKIKNKGFLIGKFEKPFQLKNAADADLSQPMKNNLNRQMKIFKRSLQSLTYSSVLNLHNLWKVYIEDLLSKEKQQESKFTRLLKADFHGAFIQVVYAKCKTYEGQEGIVIREKKKSFIIMKENNKSITIEKENTIFLLPIGKQTYRLHGCHLLMKAAERIRRDIKYHAASMFCYQQM